MVSPECLRVLSKYEQRRQRRMIDIHRVGMILEDGMFIIPKVDIYNEYFDSTTGTMVDIIYERKRDRAFIACTTVNVRGRFPANQYSIVWMH